MIYIITIENYKIGFHHFLIIDNKFSLLRTISKLQPVTANMMKTIQERPLNHIFQKRKSQDFRGF